MVEKATKQRCVYSLALALFLALLFVPITKAFSDEIEAHGLCKYNELPEEFSSTPPPDRRVFEGGDEVSVWLMFPGDSSLKFDVRVEWYQPEGSHMTGRILRKTQYDHDNFKTLYSETFIE